MQNKIEGDSEGNLCVFSSYCPYTFWSEDYTFYQIRTTVFANLFIK